MNGASPQEILARLRDLEAPTRVTTKAGGAGGGYPHQFRIIRVAADTVTVAGGDVIHGSNRITAAQADVSVAGGTVAAPTYCVLRYDLAAGTATILTTTVSDYPLPATGPDGLSMVQIALWSAYRDGASVRIKEVLWDRTLLLLGLFAP